MTSMIQTFNKQKLQRRLFQNSELNRRYYKFLKIKASTVGFLPLKKLPKIRIKNLCLVSGHFRSVYGKQLRLSRHQIKAYFAFITGLTNSSW